jgi:hypothetical protein
MKILVLIIIVVLAIAIPIGISFLIYLWIKKKEFHKSFRILALIPILIVTYFIYDAIYPDTEFYKTDFKEVTEMEFPENGEIVYKSASFPDNFGDYSSSFLAEFDKNYIKRLEKHIKTKGFIKKENKMGSDELDYIERKKGSRKYLAEYYKEIESGKYYSIGFLDDNKTVIITRVSW